MNAVQHGLLFAKNILQDSCVDFKQLQSYCSSFWANNRSTGSCLSVWQTLGMLVFFLTQNLLPFLLTMNR